MKRMSEKEYRGMIVQRTKHTVEWRGMDEFTLADLRGLVERCDDLSGHAVVALEDGCEGPFRITVSEDVQGVEAAPEVEQIGSQVSPPLEGRPKAGPGAPIAAYNTMDREFAASTFGWTMAPTHGMQWMDMQGCLWEWTYLLDASDGQWERRAYPLRWDL